MYASPRSPDLHALFEASGSRYRYTRGQSVGSSDQPNMIICLVYGFIKRYMIRNDGTLGAQIVYGPGDVFSLTHVYRELLDQSLYDGKEQYHYTAMCNTEVLRLHSDTLTKAVETNPLIYRDLFSEAGRHLHSCVMSIENMSFPKITQRVAHKLLYFANKFGTLSGNEAAIQVPLTHQELAQLLDTTRESVTRAMVELRRQGLIETERHIVIHDMGRLVDAVYHS